MFKEINKAKYLFLTSLQEDDNGSLHLEITEGKTLDKNFEISPNEEPNERIRSLLNNAKPIDITPQSLCYKINFNSYIAYNVTDESFALSSETEEYEGHLVRIYKKSNYLDFVKKTTWGDEDFPGKYYHYCFCCLDHIIDVITINEPEIRKL